MRTRGRGSFDGRHVKFATSSANVLLLGPLALLAALAWPGSTSALQGRQLSIDEVPILTIADSAAGGDIILLQPVGATLLSDGTIVVADMARSAVLFFDEHGQLRVSAARPGDGPGEFRVPAWIGQCRPDQVFVWDAFHRRMSVLDSAGELVESFPFPASGRAPFPTALSCSTAGVIAYQPLTDNATPVERDTPIERGSAAILLTDSVGRVISATSDLPATEMFRVGGGGGPRPLGKRTTVAVAKDRVYVGTADCDCVEAYDFDGRLLQRIEFVLPRREPTAENRDHAVTAFLDQVPPPAQERLRAMVEALPDPVALPPYTSIFVGPREGLWVLLSSAGDDETHLLALGSDGRVLGDVRVPFEFAVLEIGLEYVLGMSRDLLRRPSILLFHLNRGQ